MARLAVEHEEILEVLETRDRDEYPLMSTRAVTEEFDVSRRTINTRLRDLAEEGEVERVEIGGTPLYFLTDERVMRALPEDEESDDGDSSGGCSRAKRDGSRERVQDRRRGVQEAD
jgi:hypothetical protein